MSAGEKMTLILLVAIGLVILVWAVVEAGLPNLLIWLGKQDVWYSPVRTLPPGGEMYIMVKGDPDGPFDKVIDSVVRFEFNEDTHEFEVESKAREEAKKKDYLENIGLRWVGFWRYILWRKVRYDKWEKLEGTQDFGLVSKERGNREKKNDPKDPQNPSIFFRYNMATKIDRAETTENFPVNGIVVFTVRLTNPVKAFFFAGGWESQINAAVQRASRQYIASRGIDQLREERTDYVEGQVTNGGGLVNKINELGGTTRDEGGNLVDFKPKGLYDLFGIEIEDSQFVSFDLVSGDRDEKMIAATRALGIATKEAEARIATAIGKREGLKIEAEGIREEYAARASVPDGKVFAMAEAIKETKLTALGGDFMTSVQAPSEAKPRKEQPEPEK